MKLNIKIIVAVFALFVGFSGTAGAVDTLKVDVLSNGGAYLVETAYKLRCSLGPTPIRGICESIIRIENGFWPAVTHPVEECELRLGLSPGVKGSFSSKQMTEFLDYLFRGAVEPKFIKLLDINLDEIVNVVDYLILRSHRQEIEIVEGEIDQVN